jgi:hypothetical protein
MGEKTAVRYFTLEEANSAIPYISRIVEDIVAEYEKWRDCIFRYEVIAAKSTAESESESENEEQDELRREVDSVAQRINTYIDELSKVGCIFKGFDGGLVDFRSQLEGRDVFLCWKLGEPEIQHWHELDSGFAGRQPMVPELQKGESD